MAVFIDGMTLDFPLGRGRVGKMCHMWADTEIELLAMARRIGLEDRWIQRGSITHFDLTKSKRVLALAAGAVPLSADEGRTNRLALRALVKRA